MGNVGIGTWSAAGGNLIINGTGNVGIGSAWPGATLDVNGSLRTTGNTSNTTLNVGGGSVGIGSATPGTLLDVSGTIRGTQMVDTGVTASSLVYANSSQQLAAVTLSGLTLSGATLSVTDSVASATTNYAAYYTSSTAVGGTSDLMFSGNNVGIGTSTPQSILNIVGGNVGIGTWTAAGGNLIVNGGGNVGIGSAWPGQVLDVTGTARMTGFALTTGAASGYVIVGNSVGVGTWVPASTLPVSGGGGSPGGSPSQLQYDNAGSFGGIANSNVTASGNIGIGTTLSANFLDIRGNVGIGTAYAGYSSAPANGLIVQGNVGIGTSTPQAGFVSMGNVGIGTWSAAGGNLIINGTGNVGIGSAWPGQVLDVQGTVRSTAFTTNGGYTQSGTSANTFTGTPTFSNATYSALFTGGNVGIGTTTPQGAFVVTNGNVGIGTWSPTQTVTVSGAINTLGNTSNSYLNSTGGNVGIGSTSPGKLLDVFGDARLANSGNLTVAGLSSCGGVQTSAAGLMSCTSDARLKDIHGSFEEGLSAVTMIHPKIYSWKKNSYLYDGGVHYFGFIAQDVEKAIPEAVNTNPKGFKQVNTTAIIAATVNAIKDLASTTKAEVDQLTLENQQLKARVEVLEKKANNK